MNKINTEELEQHDITDSDTKINPRDIEFTELISLFRSSDYINFQQFLTWYFSKQQSCVEANASLNKKGE